MEERKKRWGDRKDGYLVRDIDALHVFMPYLMPNRADNEAVANIRIDMTKADEFIAEKNARQPEFKYTVFHVVCAALAKTIALRPKMNRFISGHRLYDRKKISLAFVVKKEFRDDGQEGFVIAEMDEKSDDSPITQLHDQITRKAHRVRSDKSGDGTTQKIEFFTRMPRWLLRFVVGKVLHMLDYYGKMPAFVCADDPDYSTVFISNLGSIKMSASYHHLANWGTNSFFVVIGEKRKQPFFDDDGNCEMRQAVDIGMTIDERIADGFYFAKSMKLFKKIMENPELLDRPLGEPVEFDD